MADTAHKKIMDKIGDRLALITTANGYFFTAGKVQQVKPVPLTPYDFPAVFYAQVSDEVTRDTYHYEKHVLTAVVYAYTASNEETPIAEKASEIGGAVITALNRATTAPLVSDAISKDLGDYVQELTATSFTYNIGEGQAPYLSVSITLRVVYLSPIGDVFTVEV